jgi:hypothetical protein
LRSRACGSAASTTQACCGWSRRSRSSLGRLPQPRIAWSARDYAARLRAFFEPVALNNAARGEKWSCGACPGRLNFVDYDRVPRFEPDKVANVLTGLTLAYVFVIWLAAALLTLLAARRLREWPV